MGDSASLKFGDVMSFAVSLFLLTIPRALYVFRPFSKQGPSSTPGTCQQIHMKPINITWRFQTADNENRYLTRNRINSSSTKPQKAITHMHLNVILPHALQTAKFCYICYSLILDPVPTSPKSPYRPERPQVITTMSPVTRKYHKFTR